MVCVVQNNALLFKRREKVKVRIFFSVKMNLNDVFSDHVLARIAQPLRHLMEAVNSQPFFVDHEVAVEVTREMKVEVNRAQHEVDVARLAKILKTRQMKGANIRWPAVQPRVDPFQTIHVRGCMSADEIWSVTLGNWFCPVKFVSRRKWAIGIVSSRFAGTSCVVLLGNRTSRPLRCPSDQRR